VANEIRIVRRRTTTVTDCPPCPPRPACPCRELEWSTERIFLFVVFLFGWTCWCIQHGLFR
jgi:hypothetical protein